jgi:hypothetical protein
MDVVKHIKHVTSSSPFRKKEIPCSLAANRAAGAALPPLEKKIHAARLQTAAGAAHCKA